MIFEEPLFPFVNLQYWDSSAGWVTFLPHVTKIAIHRGGDQDGLTIKTDRGTAAITLVNEEDPLEDGILTTGTRIRVVMRSDNTPIFTGSVLDVAASYPMDKATGETKAIVTVFAVDAVYAMTNTRLQGAPFYVKNEAGNPTRVAQTLEERVSRLASKSPVPIALPEVFNWQTVYELPSNNGADGWTLITALPAAVQPSGTNLITKSSVTVPFAYSGADSGPRSAESLALNWRTTGGAILPRHVYGIQKTITVTPGQLYQFEAKLKANNSLSDWGEDNVRGMVLGIDGVTANTGGLVTKSNGTAFPHAVSVKATTSTITLKVWINEPVKTLVAKNEFSRMNIFDIRVRRVATAYPQLLAWTMMDATLDAHMDLAANSVAAHWYADKAGTVRVAPPSEYLPVSHTFSDVKAAGELNYTDLDATKDYKDLVNSLTIRNQTFGSSGTTEVKNIREKLKKASDLTQAAEDTAKQTETAYTWQDTTSITKYGTRATEIQTNLRLPTAESLALTALDTSDFNTVSYYDLLDKLTSQRQNPRLIVHRLTWNAQADIQKAKSFELGQRILVKRGTFTQDAIIAGIQHQITPTRWMVTLTLARP
jgi:hypothetical protein